MNDEKIMYKNKASGFTLIELMIGVVLLAVLASLAAPSFVDALERRRLVGAAESFYSGVQFARTEAIKQNRTVFFQFNVGTSNQWCFGLDDDNYSEPSDLPPNVINDEVTFCQCHVAEEAPDNTRDLNDCRINGVVKLTSGSNYNDISISDSFGVSIIAFDGMNGMPDNGGGTFNFSSPGATADKVITINAVGRIILN